MQHAPGNVERPPHAPGQGGNLGVAPFAQVEQLQQFVAALANGGARQVAQHPGKAQVFVHRQRAVQGRLLEHQADLAAHRHALPEDIVASHVCLSFRGARQGGQHVDGGGFAGAVGAEQAEELAGGNGELQPVDGFQPTIAFAQMGRLNGEGGV